MNTPVPIPGLTTEPFHEEPILMGIDLASGPDMTAWAIVYVNKDGERIMGMTGRGSPPPNDLVDGFNRAAEKQRLKGRFEIEQLHRVADEG